MHKTMVSNSVFYSLNTLTSERLAFTEFGVSNRLPNSRPRWRVELS